MSLLQPGKSQVFWPSGLKMYLDCPQRYYLKYVKRHPGRVVDTSAMKRGQVTHSVLANAFRFFGAKQSFPDGIGRRVTERLAIDDYDSHEHWRRDVRAIKDWVDCALETFDTTKSVVDVEATYSFPFKGRTSEPPFELNARVDLVLQQDGKVIEHVDWKTGKREYVDNIQNIAARLAVGRKLKSARVVSTVTYLAAVDSDREDRTEMSQQEVRAGWNETKQLAHSICFDREWIPKQGPLCQRCPYYLHGCSLHRMSGTGR